MSRRQWSDEEVEFLSNYVGHMSVTRLAERLDRTPSSIVNKLKRLGLANTREHANGITAHKLASILGVDRNTVVGWVERHNLPGTYRRTRREKRFLLIQIEDFWSWAKNNKDKVVFSDIPYRELIPEPDWVNKERQKDMGLSKKQTYQPWTLSEINQLIKLRETDALSYKQIAQQLGRTEHSVAVKYRRERDNR